MELSIKKFLKNVTPVQMIVFFYLSAVLFSVVLLSMPFFHLEGVDLSLTDAFFTSVSAISVTGLSTITISETFNTGGIFALAFVCQFGGIGIMTLGTFVWLLSGKKIGFKERMLIMTDHNQLSYGGIVKLIRQILTIILTIELIGTIILSIYLSRYYPNAADAFMQGFFSSVSATTNAGFDITGASLMPYKNDFFVQIVTMILIILGAIGFPVLIECKDYIKTKDKHQFRFSLFTKLTSITFLILIIVGVVGILVLENNNFLADKTVVESIFYSLFQSTTTRSAGLSTMNMNEFSEATLVMMSLLMFIGASPSSVGGGIRTTTFAINILAIKAFIRGKLFITVFKKEISMEDIIKSFVVTFLAAFICFFSIIILMYTEDFALMAIIFEVTSAFGTTGLSLGITTDLSFIGKWIIMILMFIGRIGIITTLLMFGVKRKIPKIRHPREKVPIG